MVGRDREDPERRIFAKIKNNIGGEGTSLAYRPVVEGSHTQPCLAWEPDPVDLTAHDLASGGAAADPSSKLDEAVEAWQDMLGDGARMLSEVAKRTAEDRGIRWRTMERAKKEAGVISLKDGGRWWVKMDSPTPQDRQGPPRGVLAALKAEPA